MILSLALMNNPVVIGLIILVFVLLIIFFIRNRKDKEDLQDTLNREDVETPE